AKPRVLSLTQRCRARGESFASPREGEEEEEQAAAAGSLFPTPTLSLQTGQQRGVSLKSRFSTY
ncbi:Hypothetical predicted protein, partial [Podarcis lilfordi]